MPPAAPLPIRVVRAFRGQILLAAVLAGYAAGAVVVQAHCADLLTSDGECYLRIASYYAKGDLRHAVFDIWPPLGSWLTVPFVAAGVEPRHGFRVLIGLWGALAVVGTWRLAGRLGDFGFRISDCGLKSQIADRKSQIPRAAATACVALLVLEWSADQRVDLLVTGLLLFYLDAALDPRLLHSWPRALGVGALGGAAYLAKLFALPFFAAHLTCVVFARERGRAAARTWLLAAAGFGLVAAPWVAVLTARHGRLTFVTVVGSALTAGRLGIEDVRRATTVGLRRPPPDAYNVWQDATRPPEVPAAPAPPAGLAARIRAELGVVGRNAAAIVRHLAELDRFYLGLAALALLPLAIALARRGSEMWFAYLALALAGLLYGGGYALVHVAEKRYLWFLMLLAAVAAFHFVGLLPRLLERERWRGPAMALGAGLLLLSFGWRPVGFLHALLSGSPPGREHRLMAERLRTLGIAGPLASNDWWDGLHTAYYLDAQYAGTPAARDPKGIVAEMRREGAKALIIWRDLRLAFALRLEPALEFMPEATPRSPDVGAWAFRLR